MSLVAMAALAGLVAALAGRNVWAALLGAGVVILYWLLERAAAAVGMSGPASRALTVGIAGMVVRIAVVMVVLVAVGLISRDAFPEAVLSFVTAYTVYQGLRLALRPAPPARPRWG